MPDSLALVATREQMSIDLDAEVAAILRADAAEAHLSEGEIVDRAIRANELRSQIARVREQRPRRGPGDRARARGAAGRPGRVPQSGLMRVVADANVLVSRGLARSPQHHRC